MLNDGYSFGKRVLFCLHNFSWSWLEHAWSKEVGFLFGPENSVLGPKICTHATPNFVNGPFVALEETVHFALWDRFVDFSFPSSGSLLKKNGRRTKKSSPTPLWGHHLPVTALALSARRPFTLAG